MTNQTIRVTESIQQINVDEASQSVSVVLAGPAGPAGPAGSGSTAADTTVTPSGNLESTDVQAALEELQADVDAGGVADNSVTNAKLADVATSTVKGRATGGTGDPEDLTAAQVRTLLGVEAGATADQTGAQIKAAYEGEDDTNAFDDAAVSKLATIEDSATADQSGAQIKAAYEGEDDTNAFDDAAVSKLAAIEESATADQSGSEIKAAYEGEDDTNAFDDAAVSKLDGIADGATDDTTVDAHVADSSAAHAASAVSVSPSGNLASTDVQAALVELQGDVDTLAGGLDFQGVWNANTNDPALADGVGTVGHFYKVGTAGTSSLDGVTDWQVGDALYFADSVWNKVDNTDLVSSVAGKVGAVVLDSDDVTDATAIGKTVLTAATAAAIRTALGLVLGADVQAHSAVLDATTASFLTADESKLDAIEASATADQSASEILAAILTVDGPSSGLDADLLDGNEAAAFAVSGHDHDSDYEALGAVSSHEADTTSIHGIADTSALIDSSDSPSDLTPDSPSADSTSGSRTLAGADHGQWRWFTDSSEVTINPPTDAEDDLQNGFEFTASAHGAGGLTVDDTGLTIVPSGANLTIAQGETICLKKTGIANTWLVAGGTSE